MNAPHIYFVKAVNVEPICSTQTSMKVNVFKPASFIYRTSVAGAMLRVILSVRGENLYAHFNRWLASGLEVGREYTKLLENLPDAALTDGVLMKPSRIVRENYNVILDGTATALGTIKKAKMGPLTVYGYKIFGLDSDLTRRVINYLVHYFWTTGAEWRFALISSDPAELDDTLNILLVAMREFGFGAKHSFRGKMEPIEIRKAELKEIDGSVRGELIQPLLCGEGVSECLRRNGLVPLGTMHVLQRMEGYQPKAKVVPAIWGRFEANTGYYVTLDDRTYIITERDLSWPTRS